MTQKQIPEIENAMRTYMQANNIELDDAQFKQALMQQLFQMMEALEQEVRFKIGASWIVDRTFTKVLLRVLNVL